MQAEMLFHATGRSAFHPRNAPRCKSHRLEETFLLAIAIDTVVSAAVLSPPLNVNSTIRRGNFLPSRFRVLCCAWKKKGGDLVTCAYLRDCIYLVLRINGNF